VTAQKLFRRLSNYSKIAAPPQSLGLEQVASRREPGGDPLGTRFAGATAAPARSHRIGKNTFWGRVQNNDKNILQNDKDPLS
jgi:hypothetical protein